MTTYVMYSSTADTFGTASNATYATARSSVASTALNASATALTVANSIPASSYICSQAFFVFDTSAVPAGPGTGFFSVYIDNTGFGNHNSDTVRFRQVSTVANKIAGASLGGQALISNPGTFPTINTFYTANIISAYAISRSATSNVVLHTVGEENATVPTGITRFDLRSTNFSGSASDPFLSITPSELPWQFVGVSNVVEVTTTAHALVTTGIAGALAAGDLLVACISSRIASTTSITLPTGGAWTLVSEQKNNNTLATSSAAPSGMMAYCIRGASNPNLTFTHPVAPNIALGRIVAYRNVNQASPKDTQTSFTTAINLTAVSGTGLTTTQAEDLIVAMACGGQEAAWSVFDAVTDPTTASGATDTSTAPTPGTWIERADSLTTTGADTSLAIFDAVKLATGATGNLTATASVAAAHVVIAGAFKTAPAAAAKSLAFRLRPSRNFRQSF